VDTTRLDVFAMERVTLRWVQAELTIACARLVTDRVCCVGGAKINVDGALHQSGRRAARIGAALPA